jgi:hypothetical protein
MCVATNRRISGRRFDFVDKTIQFLRAGIHVLAIDLFPPTPRDPLGIHKVIWDEIEETEFALPLTAPWWTNS